MTAILIFLIVHWYLSLFSQTFFLHRYAAHQMFRMSKGWEKFFFIFTWVTQGSSYLSPRAYGILHRMHHAYTDTEKDPHSPSYDKNLFRMMWRTRKVYNSIVDSTEGIDPRFLINLPEWQGFDRFANGWVSRLFWALIYTGFYLWFATAWWMFLFLPINLIMGPLHGAIINWFAHKYGYRNYDMDNTSRNLLPVDVLMMGESYHNNHHMHSLNPNFGSRWFEIDPTHLIIRLLIGSKIIRIP